MANESARPRTDQFDRQGVERERYAANQARLAFDDATIAFTLTDNSYVLGDNGNKLGGKATLVLTDQTAQIAAIKDNNNATPVKNMAAGGTDWSLGTQTGNVAAYPGIEPTATAKAGQYQATATGC